MSAVISFRLEGEGSLRNAIAEMSKAYGDVFDEFGNRIYTVERKDSAFGVGMQDIIALEIKMDSFTDEFLDDLRPLLRLLKRLIEKHSQFIIQATATFSEDGVEESYAI